MSEHRKVLKTLDWCKKVFENHELERENVLVKNEKGKNSHCSKRMVPIGYIDGIKYQEITR